MTNVSCVLLERQLRGYNVPAVCILSRVVASAVARDIDIAEDNIARVCHEVVPLRGVSQVEVGDAATV